MRNYIQNLIDMLLQHLVSDNKLTFLIFAIIIISAYYTFSFNLRHQIFSLSCTSLQQLCVKSTDQVAINTCKTQNLWLLFIHSNLHPFREVTLFSEFPNS